MVRSKRLKTPQTVPAKAVTPFEEALREIRDRCSLRRANIRLRTADRRADCIAGTYKMAARLALGRRLPVLDVMDRVEGTKTAAKRADGGWGPETFTAGERKLWQEGIQQLRGLGRLY